MNIIPTLASFPERGWRLKGASKFEAPEHISDRLHIRGWGKLAPGVVAYMADMLAELKTADSTRPPCASVADGTLIVETRRNLEAGGPNPARGRRKKRLAAYYRASCTAINDIGRWVWS